MHFEKLDLREVEFRRHAKFKSSTRIELEVALTERVAIGRTTAELGGALWKIWVGNDVPEWWDLKN